MLRIFIFSLSCLALATFASAAPTVRWRGDDDFDREVKRQYWTQYLNSGQGSAAGVTQPIVVDLTGLPGENGTYDNYLLTRRHSFVRTNNAYPAKPAVPPGNLTDNDLNDLPTPWKYITIRVNPVSTSWNEFSDAGNAAPGGASGRIVGGFRRPYINDGIGENKSGWNRVPTATTDPKLGTVLARLPADAFVGGQCKVFWIPLKGNRELDDKYYFDEFSKQLFFDGAWQRTVEAGGSARADLIKNGKPDPNVRVQALSAAIGDTQMRFASHNFSSGPSGFRWDFFDRQLGSNTLLKTLVFDIPSSSPKLGNFNVTSPGYYSARTSPAYKTTSDALEVLDQSDIRCTIFANSDYDSVETGVASLSSNGTTATAILSANPYDASHQSLSGSRRFRLWNAIEFLDEPGEMVLDGANHRLYFIPFSDPDAAGAAGGQGLSAAIATLDGKTGSNQTLFVAMPQVSDNTYWAPPFVLEDCENFTFENLYFRGSSTHGVTARRTNGLTFKNCLFESMGLKSISLENCKNVTVNNCGFDKSFGGFMEILAGTDDVLNINGALGMPNADFVNRVDANIKVIDSTFQDNGQVYPGTFGVSANDWCHGVQVGGASAQGANPLVGGNLFRRISSVAVGIGGINASVMGNTIENACREVSELGAVYTGRSWLNAGNVIGSNTFLSIVRYDTDPDSLAVTGTAASNADETVPIMLDDFMVGQTVQNNTFVKCPRGIVSNAGRYNTFKDNYFKTTAGTAGTILDPSNRFRVATYRAKAGDFFVQSSRDAAGAVMVRDHWRNLVRFAVAALDASSQPSTATTATTGVIPTTWSLELRNLVGSYWTRSDWIARSDATNASGTAGNTIRDDVLNHLVVRNYIVYGGIGEWGKPLTTDPTTDKANAPFIYFVNHGNNTYVNWSRPANGYDNNRFWPVIWPGSPITTGNNGQVVLSYEFWYGYTGKTTLEPTSGGGD